MGQQTNMNASQAHGSTPTSTCAIIGGGVSGLSAAWHLNRIDPKIKVWIFESGDRVGGVLQTDRIDIPGYNQPCLIERSADMFVTRPNDALELCRELGIADDLLTTKEVTDRAWIGMGDAIHRVPAGLSMMVPTRRQPILESDLLTQDGKLRFLAEDEIPARSQSEPENAGEDESLKSFAIRRFGIEAYERIIQPMVSGIYTADPSRLSMAATMQRFVNMERSHGSLIGAMKNAAELESATGQQHADEDRNASGARYGLFRAPPGGMSQLIDALRASLPDDCIRLNMPIHRITRDEQGWLLEHANDNTPDERFDRVIVATPAAAASSLLSQVDAGLASELAAIETASSAIVTLVIRREQLQRPFTGFGIIYPHADGGQMIAMSFSSNKFAGRCDNDLLVIRGFIGGAMQSDLVDLEDAKLVRITTEQLNRSLGFDGMPLHQAVHRWRNCMPQYHIGHLDRVARIDAAVAMQPGLAIAGNSYHGVGVPACVASGKKAAMAVG